MNAQEEIYTPKNVALFEALYGKNLISLGGTDAIDNMFCDVDLHNLKLLDIGFGLGGVPYHLATKYHAEISGVEIHDWMVEFAIAHAPHDIVHLLKFSQYNDAGELPFKNNSFDLAYSKGVLNHVHDKVPLLKQVHRTLKDHGEFVIADWIHPITGTNGPLIQETQESYTKALTIAGFKRCHFRNDSALFVGYVEQLLINLSDQQKFIQNQFGEDIYKMIQNDHNKLLNDIHNNNKFAIRIRAIK